MVDGCCKKDIFSVWWFRGGWCVLGEGGLTVEGLGGNALREGRMKK